MNVYVVMRCAYVSEWPVAVYAKRGAANQRVRQLQEEDDGFEYRVDRVIFHA